MPKLIAEQDLRQIEARIAAYPRGIGITDLEKALSAAGIVMNRRSLLRRLSILIQSNRIRATGAFKGRVYWPIMPETARGTEPEESLIPLSEAGRKVRCYVSQPIQRREPVGYRRDFLLSYPESGPYLNDATRAHLHQIGRSHQGALPAGTMARQVMGRLLIDLSWASSYLEGNTYSLLETERLISFGQAAEGKDALETQMILNHKQAIEFLVEDADEIGLNRYSILNLHAILSDNLLPNPEACGRLRQIAVGIGGSVYTPISTTQLLDEYFQRVLDTADAITDPFEQAFFALVHLSYLQPFEDVNKRVARLVANIPLVRHNLCPLSFIDVPKRSYVEGILGVYELNRIELLRDVFVWGYERSVKRYLSTREELGEPDPFRMKYRSALTEVVRHVVLQAQESVREFVSEWAAKHIPETDRSRFISLVHTELKGLHEGNIARFRLRPAEFQAWREKKTSTSPNSATGSSPC
ncbi:Fic family protein [Geobacter benzoatilyticus]|uniref:Fic family protein n=1 Tax=Geobacter benzoatilyticus TaxID=2815309 RepID=A0ABX7Q7A6_9BACT|nr:Fic family protein [Geobacter benzoatilyticus]QSV46915.1 Fic family protein [Geobacter benzoatilyticus]